MRKGSGGNRELSSEQVEELFNILRARFEKNMVRHEDLKWESVLERLKGESWKLSSIYEMERTGGEPDVVLSDHMEGELLFIDCASESPKGRRNLCYDEEALQLRKEFKPENSVVEMASAMGIELLNEDQYRALQSIGNFDLKTSSWLKTPAGIRKAGGAIFGDRRYGHVFIYHNGASSYYSGRGFRGLVRL